MCDMQSWVKHCQSSEGTWRHRAWPAGHLNCLAATDLYRYLSQEHDATTAGVLLGMAAAKRGTSDSTISKMLFLHVPTRHPAVYPELELSPLVQSAALLGVGLLYQGSCHRRAPYQGLAPLPGPIQKPANPYSTHTCVKD